VLVIVNVIPMLKDWSEKKAKEKAREAENAETAIK